VGTVNWTIGFRHRNQRGETSLRKRAITSLDVARYLLPCLGVQTAR